MEQIELDRLFRPESNARKVAERLLTGRALTRTELVEGGVARTTVNRVVDVLREQGANIIRGRTGKEAVFRLVEVTEPRLGHSLPALDDEGRIVSDELVGDAHVVTVTADRRRLRGVSAGAVPVGEEVTVVGLLRDGSDVTVLLRASSGKRLRLEAVQVLGSE